MLNVIKSYLICSENKNSHFVEEPILLHCGHGICKRCIQSLNKTPFFSVICGICGKSTRCDRGYTNNPDFGQRHILLDTLLTEHLKYAYDVVLKDFRGKFYEIKEKIENFDESFENRIEFEKGEIDIQVDLLKIKLDNAGDRLKNELNEMKTAYLDWKSKNNQRFPKFDEPKMKEGLERLEMVVSESTMLSKPFLYDSQDGIKIMIEINGRLNKLRPRISFVPNTSDQVANIGYIKTNLTEHNKSFLEILKAFGKK